MHQRVRVIVSRHLAAVGGRGASRGPKECFSVQQARAGRYSFTAYPAKTCRMQESRANLEIPVTISFSMRLDARALSRDGGWEVALDAALKRVMTEFGGREFRLGRTRVGPSDDTLLQVLPFVVEHVSLASVLRCSTACKPWRQEMEARGFSRQILRLCSTLDRLCTKGLQRQTPQILKWAGLHGSAPVRSGGRLQLVHALWEVLRAGEDAQATVLSVALSKARAGSVKLWGERCTEAMIAAFDAEEVSALELFAAKRVVEERLWDCPGGPNSAWFSPTHDPERVRNGRPLLFFHSYTFNRLAVDGNCAAFPLCAYEAHLPQGQTLDQGVDETFDDTRQEVSWVGIPSHRIVPAFDRCFQVLVADDEAFITLDPTANERRVSVLPAALRESVHAAPLDLEDESLLAAMRIFGSLHFSHFDLDTTTPPEGAWAPRPGEKERSFFATCWSESLDHRNDCSRTVLCHGSLNSRFPGSLISTFPGQAA